MDKKSNCNKLRPLPPMQCLQNFPFLDYDFDATTDWAVMQELGKKTNEIICFINNVLDDKLIEYIDKRIEYIDKRFNDIMLNSMYDAETETLILYLKKETN